MSRIALLIILSLSLKNSFAQNPFMKDVNGRPFFLRVNYVPDGSPYLYDDYNLAEITLATGKVYPNIPTKINLIEKEVTYMDEKGAEFIATVPITRIMFYSFMRDGNPHEAVVLQGFSSEINAPSASIYQVLQGGKAFLLKELVVTFTDNKKYGEATITRTFKKKEIYEVLMPGSRTPVKFDRNKEAVAALFDSSQAIMADYIDKQKLKCRSDADLIQIFKYYNSLPDGATNNAKFPLGIGQLRKSESQSLSYSCKLAFAGGLPLLLWSHRICRLSLKTNTFVLCAAKLDDRMSLKG
ncbi:MAG TPA: hypothetical protein VK644_12005 [Chitinophagaceae bacterium]|nr:hypothetical protein [Chitinophagaceae bacterium]